MYRTDLVKITKVNKSTRLLTNEIMTGFHKAHMRAFVYSLYHVYCNKMHAYAFYGIQPINIDIINTDIINIISLLIFVISRSCVIYTQIS